MALTLAFGNHTAEDHCRFIPVYFMVFSLLTASWPSLLENVGISPVPLEFTIHRRVVTPPTPLAGVIQVNEESSPAPLRQAQQNALLSDWLEDHDWPENCGRLQDHDLQVNAPQNEEALALEAPEQRSQQSSSTRPDLLWLHMGPSSSCSNLSAQSGSLSLSSRAAVPSEISDNALHWFQSEIAPGFIPRTTSRRVEINALGRTCRVARRNTISASPQFRVGRALSV